MAVNGSNTSETVPSSLLQACKEGNIYLVQEVLSSPSCGLLACDDDGNTALHLAADQGHLAMVQELADRYNTPSAGKNTKGQTPLHLASMRGHSAVVEALTQRFHGDLEARNESGDTSLHLTALFGHIGIVNLLCQQFHCDPSVKGHDDCTLIQYYFDIVRRLIIDHGLDPLAEETPHYTMLSMRGCSNVLFTLISEYNCSPHVRSANSTLPSHGGWWWTLATCSKID